LATMNTRVSADAADAEMSNALAKTAWGNRMVHR